MGLHQTRLSTGKRINSAEDDAAGYHIAKHLESRTRGLSQALDNVSTAKNVLNIAEGGFQSQMTILQTVKEKLTQAADGSLSDAQRGAIGDQIDALLTELDDINSDTKFNDNALMGGGASGSDVTTVFHVGEGNGDTLSVTLDNSYRRDVGESTTAVDLDDIVSAASGASASDVSTAWAALDQTEATAGISTADSAIKALAKSIQSVGDYNARLSSKEESLSLAVSNTEATRSRIEDADFAKEQMSMMKLQILQQTTVSSFSQANAAPQMVLGLLR